MAFFDVLGRFKATAMHIPKHFEETRLPVLFEHIREYPLGALIVASPHGLNANHIPFELRTDQVPLGLLQGHVSRANPVWRQDSAETSCLVIFQGPQAYVSPSWYPSKEQTGKAVPTWNYTVVHAHGWMRAVEDKTWLRRHLEELTSRQEAEMKKPWTLDEAPSGYMSKLMNAIVGIEIHITQLLGKDKLGQDRSAADIAGTLDGLERQQQPASRELARLTRRRAGGE